MHSQALIGIGAGLLSAAFFISASAGSVVALFLVYLTPLPLYLAGLGWGAHAILYGAGSAAALTLGALGGNVALSYAAFVALPAILLTHLALLYRPLPKTHGAASTPGEPQATTAGATGAGTTDTSPAAVEWYPIGRLIAWAAIIAGALGCVGIILLGAEAGSYQAAVRKLFDQVVLRALSQGGAQPLSAEEQDALALLFSRLLPAASAAMWLGVSLANLWLAAKIAALSGRLKRPWPHLVRMHYPQFLGLALAAAFLMSLAPGVPGAMATSFLGAFILAYLLLGLAVIHWLTRGASAQPILLALLYISILLVGWVGLIVALLGISEPLLGLRERASDSRPPPAAS